MEKTDLVLFDKDEHLNILTEEGKEIWRGHERFGGTNNIYETRKKKVDPYRPQESPPWRFYVPGRILVRNLNGHGIPEIIVNRNDFASGTFFEKVRAYEKAEVYNLIWEENRLTTNWKTREIKGYVADYQVRAVGAKVDEELVVGVILIEEGASGLISRKMESNILFFKLN